MVTDQRQVIGYVRVSTPEQNTNRQKDALKDCDKVYTDESSGRDLNRPGLQEMLDYLRPGDTVKVDALSRLSRCTRDIIELMEHMSDIGVNLISLNEYANLYTPQGRFNIITAVASAELEVEMSAKRQKEGIESAKARGKHLGRPQYVVPDNFDSVVARWEAKEITAVQAMKELGMSKTTFYRQVKERETVTGKV